MTVSRYEQRRKLTNAKKYYENLFKARDLKFIRQYESPKFKYPTDEQIGSLELFERVWKRGDKFSKVAEQEYGDARMWWVIAWFNKTPTEAHLKYGDVIQIPFPLERALDFMGV